MRKLLVTSLLFGAVSLSIPISINGAQPDCQFKLKATNRVGDIAQSGQQLAQIGTLYTTWPKYFNLLSGCTGWALSYDSEGFTNIGVYFQSAGLTYTSISPFFTSASFIAYAGTVITGTNPMTDLQGSYLTATG